ncbi:MAG: sodium:proton antiporter NhaD [Saprospiraceae bacterium]
MSILIVLAFVVGYAFIAFEHPLKIDKAATAVLTGVVCWVLLVWGFESMPLFSAAEGAPASVENPASYIDHALFEHLGEIAGILFFLLGAMTVVELIDAHDGFRVITDRIATTDRVRLLWILSMVSFFLSAALDNLTTAIVMSALIRRVTSQKDDMWLLAGFVIIAANAGGAWSPIGDVTTIMLWIGGQISASNVIKILFVPSLISLLVPLTAASFLVKGQVKKPAHQEEGSHGYQTTPRQQRIIFALGVMSLLFVPFFKSLTHLPPFLGILFGLGVLWVVTEFMHNDHESESRKTLTVVAVLRRIDTPSILFFLGILLAVAALETSGHLRLMADLLDRTFGNIYAINTLIGLLSSIVDNVPLVAATMGMYPLSQFPMDHPFWELLAYCAGTGGSVLIIGSAAGVAAMGVLKIDFIWYLRKISLYALAGYFAGILAYYLFT